MEVYTGGEDRAVGGFDDAFLTATAYTDTTTSPRGLAAAAADLHVGQGQGQGSAYPDVPMGYRMHEPVGDLARLPVEAEWSPAQWVGGGACFLSDIPFLTIERLPKEAEPLPNPPPAKEDFACQPIAPPAREALGAQTDPLPVPPLMTERNTGTDAPAPAPVMTPRQAQTDPEAAAVAVPTDTMWCQTDAPEDATQVYTRGLQTDPLPELPRLDPEPVTHFSFESFGVDDGAGATGCLPLLTSTQNLGAGGTGGAGTTPGMAMGASTLGGMGGFNSSSAGASGHGADQSLLGITNSALAEAIFPGSTVTPKRPPPVRAQVYTQGMQTEPEPDKPKPIVTQTEETGAQALPVTEETGAQTDPPPEPDAPPPQPEPPLLKNGYASRKPIKRTAELLHTMYGGEGTAAGTASAQTARLPAPTPRSGPSGYDSMGRKTSSPSSAHASTAPDHHHTSHHTSHQGTPPPVLDLNSPQSKSKSKSKSRSKHRGGNGHYGDSPRGSPKSSPKKKAAPRAGPTLQDFDRTNLAEQKLQREQANIRKANDSFAESARSPTKNAH